MRQDDATHHLSDGRATGSAATAGQVCAECRSIVADNTNEEPNPRGARWGAHRWWGEGGYLNRGDIRARMGEAGQYGGIHNQDQTGELAARLPGQVPHGAGWHNLYARQGNAYRNMDVSRTNAFHSPTVQQGEHNDVFADHSGNVYR